MTSVSVAPTPMPQPVIDNVNDVLPVADKAAVKRLDNVPDCIVQQRHILAMMGIEVWAQKTQKIVVADYDTRQQELASAASLTLNAAHSNAPVSNLVKDSVSNSGVSNPRSSDLASAVMSIGDSDNARDSDETRPTIDADSDIHSDIAITGDSNNHSRHSQALREAQQLEQSLLQRVAGDARSQKSHSLTVKTAATEQTENRSTTPRTAAPIQVAAFELIGVKYHNWVLLVDAVVLKNQSLSLLWNNMLQALALTPEYLQFPICAGISDKESAEASVAGFVFRLGKSEDVQVAALTPMPDGAQQDALIRLPYLVEMFEDSDKKRQLWQRLCQS